MPAEKTSAMDPAAALKVVDALEKHAAKTTDRHLKRMLLASGCEIIDHVVRRQTDANAA